MTENNLQEVCDDLIEQIRRSGTSFVESAEKTISMAIKADKLLICGMGGSGISGNYIQKMAEYSTPKRIIVNKTYTVPEFIDDTWSAVVISYSGNTEETISCFNHLIELNIEPVCISSNGKLQEFAEAKSLQFVKVPQGIAPRAAFPYLCGSVYGLVQETLDLPEISGGIREKIIQSSVLSNTSELDMFSDKLLGNFPIILQDEVLSNVGLRFRCQLNENSKLSAASFIAPEFSHNAIVGFDGKDSGDKALILLRSSKEHERTKIHLDFLRDNMDQLGYVHEFVVSQDELLVQHLALTWMLDYISIRLALIQGIDPLGVPSIDQLKAVLRKQ